MAKKNNPTIGIIGGTSNFGQWFRFFFEKNGCEVLIAGRKTALTPEELAKRADIVIVSVPIRETEKTIKKIRNLLKSEALLCDFTSVKESPLKEMMKRKKGGVLGMHPLFGPLVPTLEGQTIIFSPGRKSRWENFLKNIFEKNGGKVVVMKAREHDRQMAMIQAMTHFLNISYAKVLQKQKVSPQNIFSTPIFRLQTLLSGRVLGANPELYTDLEMENKMFKRVLKDYLKAANDLGKMIAGGKKDQFEKEFKKISGRMENFIPIAQKKTAEISYLLDRQTVEIAAEKKSPDLNLERSSVACLGPEGTYSHIAAKKIFSKSSSLKMMPTIEQAFKAVLNNEVKYAVVPAENSIAGIIQETLDNLMSSPVVVLGGYRMPIHHCFLARTKDRSKIKIIKSHSQPLEQCRDWIKRNFPQAELIPSASTVEAILSTKDRKTAFIGSEESAREYSLEILEKNIEDKKDNATEFYVIAKKENRKITKKLKPKNTLLMIAVYDRPGVLKDVLEVFASRNLNLAKLHSRASAVKAWDYYFFLEVKCPLASRIFQEAIRELKDFCSIIKVAGET